MDRREALGEILAYSAPWPGPVLNTFVYTDNHYKIITTNVCLGPVRKRPNARHGKEGTVHSVLACCRAVETVGIPLPWYRFYIFVGCSAELRQPSGLQVRPSTILSTPWSSLVCRNVNDTRWQVFIVAACPLPITVRIR